MKNFLITSKTRASWIYKARGPWILGRMACMGTDTFKLLNLKIPLINIQKGRVDYLVDVESSKRFAAKTHRIAQYISRSDITGLIAQEENAVNLPKNPPLTLLMDSFSELTDQRFYSRTDNSSFLSGYTDVNHTPKFKEKFECKGLLPLDDLSQIYEKFFDMIAAKYGEIPVFFMHFPKRLEERELFQQRHDRIRLAIEGVSTKRRSIISLTVPDNYVEWPCDDKARFPYHFHPKCYEFLAAEIKKRENLFQKLAHETIAPSPER